MNRALWVWLASAAAMFAQQPSDRFYTAIRNNDLPTLRALVKDHGANLADSRAQSPLMIAAAYGSLESFKFLLDSGADAKAVNGFGTTALHLSAGNIDKVRLLLDRGTDVNAKSQIGRTPLMVAAATHGASAVVKALLQKGAEVDAADAQGSTALQLAAGSGDLTSVRTLLERGADPNAKQRFGWTALMKSAGHGDLEIVRLLIAHNADVNAVSGPDDGRVKHGPTVMGYLTPLHWAAVSGRDEIVRVLLDAGAKVDKPDVRGMTALMTAVSTDHASANMVRMFLQNGSDPSIKSEIGESTFDWARKFNNPAVLALLKLPPVTAASYVKPVVDAVTLTPRQAVERALPPIQRAADFIFKDNGCVACHAQPMAEMAANLARSRGWHVEESLSKTSLDAIRNQLITNVQPYLQGREGGGFPDSLLYATMALAANNVPPTPSTDSVVHYLAAKQYDAGYWEVFDGFRSPMQDGNFSRTAMAIRALAVYGTPGRKPEFDKRITQAAKWLASEAPFATEPHVMQLLGLYWANAAPRLRATGLRELTAQQHPDGGWSQNPYLETDAYATGQVLYAMHELGVPSTDPAFRRGVDFLLRTQQEDGTWHVKNRAMKLQPYFESGFPYEHDQWISSAATAWASMALSLSEPEQTKVAATR